MPSPRRMADDREILRQIWEAKIPVCFALSSEEIFLNSPEPYYLMVPRVSYFPLLTDKVRRHFTQYINPEHANNEMWLEHNGQPMKWHHPFGLLYDRSQTQKDLPFNLTVHFDNYPDDRLTKCPNKEAIRSHFMAMLKEADSLKHKGNVINSMQEKEHFQLWSGISGDKFDQFWQINKKLMESNEGFRNIPIRVHTEDKLNMQRLVKPYNEVEQRWTTAKDALRLFFDDIESYRAILHGIEPPLDTPIQWMSEHLSYPDNFLHFVLVKE